MNKKDLVINMHYATAGNKTGYAVESKGSHNIIALLMLHSWATQQLARACKEKHVSVDELNDLRTAMSIEDLLK